MNHNELTYEEAIARVEELVGELEKGETNLDALSGKLAEAKKLLALCREKLKQTETDVNLLLNDGKE
ncbi:MAG: exodeoxyribonuclease VII small subunit [Alloprevotella sp.]|nr:exodeoxyribonuclease VII small subunit [Alloprevotella sp.]